jgi:hypothetical protein
MKKNHEMKRGEGREFLSRFRVLFLNYIFDASREVSCVHLSLYFTLILFHVLDHHVQRIKLRVRRLKTGRL